jgi:adenosine deaminase
LTPGGLSKWDLLQLSCNGFRSAFYPYKEKKELIRKVENYLGSLIKKGSL